MRRSLTEREVYRKLKILERHSAFKQPYKFKTHVQSELNYEFPGYPKINPGGGDYPDLPPGVTDDECDFACNPSMLDCEGGCTTIVCTCIIGGAEILEDPTGSARLMTSTSSGAAPLGGGLGSGTKTIAVCIDDATCIIPSETEYPKVVVRLWPFTAYDLDDPGAVDVEVAIVDCRCCCEELSLTGADTVNAGGTWTGTITPACPTAECSVVSNSGCSLGCSINDAGSQVTVGVGGSDCGGFSVTVFDPESGCQATDSKFVTINGGSWSLDKASGELGMAGCDVCGSGGGQSSYGGQCYIGEYQYGGYDPIDGDCSGNASVQCKAHGIGDPCDDGIPGVNICGWPFGGCGPTWNCPRWGWWRCKYTCSC